MKGKISQLLSRFSLYDTTGLAKETRKNLRLVILGVVIGNVSFTITGGTALTGYIKALGASDFVYSVLLAMPYVAKFMQLVTSYILERTRKRARADARLRPDLAALVDSRGAGALLCARGAGGAADLGDPGARAAALLHGRVHRLLLQLPAAGHRAHAHPRALLRGAPEDDDGHRHPRRPPHLPAAGRLHRGRFAHGLHDRLRAGGHLRRGGHHLLLLGHLPADGPAPGGGEAGELPLDVPRRADEPLLHEGHRAVDGVGVCGQHLRPLLQRAHARAHGHELYGDQHPLRASCATWPRSCLPGTGESSWTATATRP